MATLPEERESGVYVMEETPGRWRWHVEVDGETREVRETPTDFETCRAEAREIATNSRLTLWVPVTPRWRREDV